MQSRHGAHISSRTLRDYLTEVFNKIKGKDDLPLDYLFQTISEDKGRLRGHQPMPANPRANGTEGAIVFHTGLYVCRGMTKFLSTIIGNS